MPTKRASYPVVGLKADAGEQGIVEAIVSVFGNVDLVGDRVVKGAFTKTIADWKAANGRGKFLPFTDGHDWSREGRIGKVLQMAERDEGLWVKAQLFMGQESARDVFTQIKEGVVGEFSFAYDVLKEKSAEDGANELLQLDILDAAAAVHGANPATRLLAVKSKGEKVGRTLSAKNESLFREAIDGIRAKVEDLSNVLATLGNSPQESAGAEGKAEEPEHQAKAEDPPSPNAELRALLDATEAPQDENQEGGS